MSPTLKRRLSSQELCVSPPPRTRRRLLHGELQQRDGIPTPDHKEKSEHTARFCSWNVNGIQPLLQKTISFSPDSTYPLRNFLKLQGWPHIVCLQEVKIGRDDEQTQRRVQLAANAGTRGDEPHYSTHFSLPRDKFNAIGLGGKGKVHGVATLVRDDSPFSSAITTRPDFDLEGRILIHDIPGFQIVLINGYWVNGTSNPYWNSETGELQGTRHDHKLRFHAHMLELCKSFEAQHKHVLLLGDMNVALRQLDGHPNLRTTPIQHVKNRADFNAKFLDKISVDGLKGLDIFRHFHGDMKKFTYHGRGRPWGKNCDRVDLIIASPGLCAISGALTDTGICDSPRDRGHSDHVPIWVSVDMSKLRSEGDPKIRKN